MISYLVETIQLLHFNFFLISILLFIIGYVFAPTAYYKKIRFFTAYPLWIAAKMESWAQKKWNPFILFFFLLCLNSVSLYLNFLSGLVPFLPVIFAVWTGLNIGMISYHTLKGHFYYTSLINPVALFELPAAFIAFTAAIQYNLTLYLPEFSFVDAHSFGEYVQLFYYIVFPLLIISGIIETLLIHFSHKLDGYDDDDSEI
jgi:hypothetical protein